MASGTQMALTPDMYSQFMNAHPLAAPVAEAFDDGLNFIERGFSFVGLTTPASRFISLYTLSELVLNAVQPAAFYQRSGKARPFSIWSSATDSTLVPHWLVSITLGTVAALYF